MNGSARLGLVGLGDISLNYHLPALLRSSRVQLGAIADTSELRRTAAFEVLDGHDVPILSDAAGLMSQNLDGIVLATPPWVTPLLAQDALRRGLFVLAEKPVAVSMGEAQKLGKMPEEWSRKYQLGLTYRHDLAIERLRDAVASEEFGRGPLLVRASIYDEALRADDDEHYRRIIDALSHGDPSLHEGAHVFDWIAVILGSGQGKVIDAWSLSTLPGLPSPNIVGVRLTFSGGTVAIVEFGWLVEVLPPAYLEVTGQKAQAHLDLATFDLTITRREGVESLIQERPKMERCFDRQLDLFVDLVLGVRKTPSVGVQDGVDSLVIASQIAELIAVGDPTR